MTINHEELLERTYILAKENNKLLKKMRRGAFVGGIFKLLFWAAMVLIPWWIYTTTLKPVLEQSMGMLEQVQGAAGQAGVSTEKLQGLLDMVPSIDVGSGLDKLKSLTE